MEAGEAHIGDLQDTILIVMVLQTCKPHDIVGFYVTVTTEHDAISETMD